MTINASILTQVTDKLLDRVNTEITGLEFLGIPVPRTLVETGHQLSRGNIGQAVIAHQYFMDVVHDHYRGHPKGATVNEYVSETQAFLKVLLNLYIDEDQVQSYGHDPEKLVKSIDAQKWNMDYSKNEALFDMTPNHTEVGLEFYNDWWTGIGNSQSEGPMDDFRMINCLIRDNKKWSSRAKRIRENVIFERCTFLRNRDEHFIYHNTMGFGPGVSQAEADERICVGIIGCRFDDCDSQGVQFVSAMGRPEETPDPVNDNTPGGQLMIMDTLFTNTGQGVHNGNTSSRPSFTLSFFPGKHGVKLVDVTVDNSKMPKTTGALLVQDHPWVHAENCNFNFPKGDRSLAKIEDTESVVIKGGTWVGSRSVGINNCPNILIDGVESNVDLYVDGAFVGPLSAGYSQSP